MKKISIYSFAGVIKSVSETELEEMQGVFQQISDIFDEFQEKTDRTRGCLSAYDLDNFDKVTNKYSDNVVAAYLISKIIEKA